MKLINSRVKKSLCRHAATALLAAGTLLPLSLWANPHYDYIPASTPVYYGTPDTLDLTGLLEWIDAYEGEDVRRVLIDMKRSDMEKKRANEPVDETQSGADVADEQAATDLSEQVEKTEDLDVESFTDDEVLAHDATFEALVDGLSDFVDDPEGTLRAYGLDPTAFNWSLYVVGRSPVLRFSLGTPDLFQDALMDWEASYEINPLVQSLNGTEVRIYDISGEKSDKGSLAFAIVGGDAVFSISAESLDLEHVSALGITSIEETLAKTATVEDLKAEYGYTGEVLGYLDTRNIADLLFEVAATDGKDELTHPACRPEIESLTAIWPRLVWGYRSLSDEEDRIAGESHSVVEINHAGITGALKKFRGFIPPDILNADSLVTYAIGLDVSRLGQAAGELAILMTNLSYQCPQLSDLNEIPADKVQQGIIGINMMSGFAQGVRGFAGSVFDFSVDVQPDDGEGGIMANFLGVDLILSVQAKNPQMLLQMAKALPMLAPINVPEDGTPIDLREFIPEDAEFDMPVPLSLAQRENSIVFFAGPESTKLANINYARDAPDNGFFYVSTNLRRYMELMVNMIATTDVTAGQEDTLAEIEEFMQWVPDGQISYTIDFTDKGVEVYYSFDFAKSVE